MSVVLADFIEQDENNMGGLPNEIYVAKAEDVATWPTLPNLTGAQAAQAVLLGNFALKPGVAFRRVRVTLDTGMLNSEEQGETDGVSYKHMVKVFKSGLHESDLGFLSVTKNTGLVFIVPDANNKKFVVGSQKFPARRQTGGTSGTGEGTTARRGSEVTFFSYGNGPAPIYNGTIPGIDDSGSGS
jgi:hypothetical protein